MWHPDGGRGRCQARGTESNVPVHTTVGIFGTGRFLKGTFCGDRRSWSTERCLPGSWCGFILKMLLLAYLYRFIRAAERWVRRVAGIMGLAVLRAQRVPEAEA